MNKFFKRLALLLAVLMFVSMMPVQLFADNSVAGEEQSNGTGESYLTISGIKGFEGTKFESFAEAYAAIKPVLERLCAGDALGQGVATAGAFDALFTNRDEKGNATLTYTISGNIVYDETGYANLLTMGRRASHYGNDRHLINFKFVGAPGKEADTLTVNSNITLPYEWWGEKAVTSISFENLTITGSAPSGLYPSQPYFEGINFKVDNCNLKGIKIYNCSNVKGTYTITNSTLDGTGTPADAYAIHLQGNKTEPLTINISGNTISGYDRGINIDQNTANATISSNKISIKDAGRSCIQLSSLANVAIADNTLELTGGNAITLHENLLTLTAAPNVTVEGNTITGNGYLIYDGAAAKSQAFTSKNLKLTIGTNTVASTVDTKQGVYGGEKFGLSKTVATVVKDALTPAYVATVNGKGYTSLAKAIAAATRNSTVKLLADTRENVTIDKALTLDLNGFTLNGGTEKGKATLKVDNCSVTIKDSSEKQTGTIMREDTDSVDVAGSNSYYVIDIQGKNGFLKFESGNVKNTSGVVRVKGASLVRLGDDSVAGAYPTLTITGGTFTQDNFIVIKVDRGTLHFKGGTVNSANSYAIENWNNAYIKGGTVNGTVSTWVYSTGAAFSKLEISAGVINGNVCSVNYDSASDKQARIYITGGEITGTLGTYTYNNDLVESTVKEMATIEVTGGTFSSDPSKYVVEGSAITDNGDGTFGVAKAYLAKVGENSYYTMDEAFKAQTASGEPIVLLRDYTTGSTFNSGSINRTVDLNGHTWTCTGTATNSAAFEINYPNASLTVKNGKIVSSQLVGLIPSASGGTIKYDNSSLTFENVEMSTTATSGIETNGNNTNDTVTLKNSTLNVPNGFGIYFPSSGELIIENSKITAKTMGVQVCSGAPSITGADTEITVTGDAVPKTENDGAIQDGAAISIVNRTGYNGLVTVTVSGGKFTAKKGNSAIKAYNWENKTESDFTADKGTVAVSGGTFSSAVPADLCAEGLVPVANADGTYGVKAASVAKIGTVEYATLDDAIEAAQNGEVIFVNAGEYNLNGRLTYTGKAFTIKAADGANVSFDMSAAVALSGAKITFDGVTFDYKTNGNYIGIQHADTLEYNNCTINGQVFLYATNETFNVCKFIQTSADAYNVWTYGAKNVEFNKCVFNCVGKSVLLYNEGANTGTDLTVTDTTFKASAPVEGKAAIEIDTSLMRGQSKITVDTATADKITGFANGSNSGNTLWNDKKQTAETNKNTTVIVNGVTVFEPAIIDLDTFIKKLVASGYNFDGTLKNGGKLTVKWSPVSGCYDARTGHTCTVNNAKATGNTPKRVNSGLTQFQLFEGSNVAVTIKNVKFVYEPAAFTVCENSGWKGSFTAEQAPAGQLYFMTTGDVTVDSCYFEKVVFTTFNTTGTSIVNGCTFKDVYNSYAIKDIRGENVSVTGTTIENCGGGIMVSSTGTVSNVTITDNTFNNVDTAGTAPEGKVGTRAILQIASSGDYKSTAFVFSGNKATSCGPVIRQLNATVAPVGSSLKYLTESPNSASGLYTSDSNVTYVAEVKFVDGTVEKYETLIEALKAGLSGKEGTITKLLANGTVSGVTIARIIDLNGCTLTTDDLNLDSSNGKDLIVTDSSVDKNGKLVITGSAEMSIAHKIILKSGTIETSRTINQNYGTNNTIEINGGTLILKNGATLTNSMPRTVTITDGKFITEAGKSIFKAGSSTLNVIIKGGDFTRVGKLTEITSNIKFSISGGTFNADVPEEYCAKDYYPAHFNDGTKGVKKETVSTEKELRRALYEAALDGSLTRIKLTGNIKLEMLYAAENFGTEKLDDNAIGDTFNRYKFGVHPTAEDPDHWNPLVINQTQEERVVYGAYYHVSATDERIARLVIKAGQNVVIDLNGHTIDKNARATHGDWSNTCTDIIGNYGTLEIKNSAGTNGTIKGNGYNSCNGAVLHNYEGGEMTVGAVNVDGNAAGMTAGTGQYVIANDGGKTIINGTNVYDTATSASLVVNTAGEITITGNATLNHLATKTINVKGGDVIIESATIISDKYSIYAAKGKTTITGEVKVNGTGKMAVESGEIVKTANATVGGVPEGYAWFDNADGTQSLSKAYAKIGETYYKSLADALEAANAGDTVTLLADINTPEKTYEITKSLTIDLNGKTVTGSGYDGVFEVTGKNIEVFLNATNGGKVIAVENSGSDGKYAMAVWMCGAGSTLTINGGEFTQNITSTNDKQMDMIYASAGTIIINSGSFTSGTPKWTLNIKDSAYKNGTANIIVNGGTFTDYDPRNAENEGKGTSLVADGVGIDKNADGTFTAKSGMAAQIVDADGNSVAAYATLADAIAAAKDGDTVKLLANLTETDAAGAHIVYDLTGKTLDLNGFTYSHNNFAHVFEGTGGTIKNGKMVCLNSSSYALFIGDEVYTTSFTVDGVELAGGINIFNASGVVLKNLTVNGSNYYAVWLDEHAAATIESGTYNAGSKVVFNAFKLSSLTVTGGTINTKGMGLMGTSGGTLSVSGGTFDAAVPEEYCADGFIPTQNEDGTYGVKEAMKGSKKNPYTLKELGKMTRAEYIAAQEALGGTMYVEIGDYSYGTNGVLGNGKRDDTTGQTEDRSVLNGYNSNGYLRENNDGANGKKIIFVGGSITSGVTGYTSIDNIGTSLLLAVPAYTNVTFEGTTFNNVMSFDYQLYTGPWSQLGELKFSGCTFNGIIVGAIAAQTLTFNGCEFKNYTNTTEANNSNPTWIRPAYGNWTQGDNEGQGSDFKSLTTINFTNNTVTSTRPVKFEYISQWDITSTVTATGNYFDITAQSNDTSIKNVGLYLGAHTDANEFHLVAANNTKSLNTAALYTIPSGKTSLPVDSTVKNTAGESIELTDALKWKAADAEKDKIVLKTVIAVASIGERRFATLEEAVAAVAKNGEEVTIKLLSNITAGGIDVAAGQNIVFDFDGHTYTLDGSMVGSTGTKTNGFRFLKGSTVVLKNGTLANGNGSPAKAMINSYATLKLVDFSVDARTTAVAETGSAYGYAALYISNGVTTVTGNGNYTTSDDNFVILIANVGDYTDGASLVFDENYTGTVSGRVSTGNKQNATVEIKNGKFDLKSIDVENTNTTVTISGGKFKNIEIAGKYLDNKAFDTEADADGYYTVKDHPITNMGLSIGESLTLRITVDESYKNGKLKYTYIGAKDGKVHSGIVYRAEKDKKGNWVFRISDINAQRADVIYTVQYVDESEKEVGSAKEVSILKYCEGLVEQYKNADEAVKNSVNTLVCKLLNYSAAAMDYRQGTDKDDRYNNMTWGERATALRKRAVELCGTVTDYAFEVSHEIRDYGYDDNAVGANGEKKVGIEFSDKIRLFFNINYNENYTYTYNGLKCIPEEVSSASTTHRIYVTVAPFAYDSEHCIEISDADGFVYEIAYSLDNVLEIISEKNSGTAISNLAKATYEYCRALTDFAKYFK